MATLDLLSLEDAKDIIRAGQLWVDDDPEIRRAITGLSERLDQRFGPGVVRTITEYHSGGDIAIRLDKEPVSSITSIHERIGETSTELTPEEDYDTAGEFLVVKSNGENTARILRRTTGRCTKYWASGVENIKVVYVAGRFATTAAVDSRWQDALGVCLQAWFRKRTNSTGQLDEFVVPYVNFPTFAIPQAVVELLGAEDRPVL